MNPLDAVDVVFDPHQGYTVWRRRDQTCIHLPATSAARLLARAVLTGLGLQAPEVWQPETPTPAATIAVVWRSQGQLRVGTPVYAWGQASEIVLKPQPTLSELGQALRTQLAFGRPGVSL